ncbi:MAG: serine/threonine protein kinase [Planctomycetes bacterium]|nr:serine/threonine protein kinase [Planctomycetota bacterium]MCB9872196.1 serine/threonine protein kinase [Planctomycetota bacterium]
MSEEQIVAYVQRALELAEDGEPVDLASLCAAHPELLPAVADALAVHEQLPGAVSSDPLLGTVLDDRYSLDEFLGAGAMGVVYAGCDRSLDRVVAVKVLQHGLLADEARRLRFVREARILAALDHPHIVKVFDHGTSAHSGHYLVMERLHGVSLAPVLEEQVERSADGGLRRASDLETFQGTRIDLDWLPQVATWGAQLASALASAHAVGVFHRDIKPSNILIDRLGRAILLDFGIAAREGEGSLTVGGTTLGTPWYMAPEQALDPSAVTAQVDIYGLCAAIYHLVTLQPPYDGDYHRVLLRLQTEDPAPPRSVRKELPRDLCAILEKGMERDPRRRYSDMAALEADLRAFLAHLPVQARPLSPLTRRLRRIRARPWPWIGAAGVLLAVAATAVFTVLWQGERERARVAAEGRYWTLVAALPPSVALEGTLLGRLQLDPEERRQHIGRMSEILDLRPDDVHTRMLRSALHQDDGNHAASLADLRWLAEHQGSPYLDAVVARYSAVPAAQRGIEAVSLDGLPAPQQEIDHFVAAFHAARRKDNQAAQRSLEKAPRLLAARLLGLNVRFNLGHALRASGSEAAEFERVREQARQLAAELGHATAHTLYFDGAASLGLHEPAAAVQPLREAARLCGSFGAHFNLGCALRALRRLAAAEQHLARAAALRPGNLNAVVQLVQTKSQRGDFDGAMRLAEAMPERGYLVEPWHKSFLKGYVESHRYVASYARGDESAARAAARRAIAHFDASLEKVAPEDRQRGLPLRGKNDAQLLLDQRPEFLRVLMRELRRNPLNPAHLLAMAKALQRFPADAHTDQELQQCLVAVARALFPSGEEAVPTDASGSPRGK